MNDNFKCFYKILKSLELALDVAEIDIEAIGYKKLSISKIRWCKYLEMLLDCGYIKNIEIEKTLDDEMNVKDNGITITLKGLEYLSENTIMQRLYKNTLKTKNLIK